MRLNYIITFVFLLLSSKANFLCHNDTYWGIAEIFFLAIAIYNKRIKKQDVDLLIKFCVGYLAFIFLRNFVNQLAVNYIISDVLYLFKFVLFSYLFCIIVREEIPYYLSQVIKDLAVISICFYVIQLALGGDVILSIGSLFEKVTVPSSRDGYTNFLLFSFDKIHFYRNSGFCWEPGAFGCFLIIAMVLRFFVNGFRFDKNVIVLVIAIATTFSTTTYLALFITLILYYRVNTVKITFMNIVVVGFAMLLILSVPFLADKISYIYEADLGNLENIDQLSGYYNDENRQIPLNRFSSILFATTLFGNKLILGLSNQYNELYINDFNVNLSNGIVDFCAKFGIVGFIFLLVQYNKFCSLYLFRTEYNFYAMLILLTISFGEPILILPISLVFLFLFQFVKDGLYSNYSIEQA